MATLAQMKRKDVKFLYTVLNFIIAPIKLPFVILYLIGDISTKIVDYVNYKLFAIINWYIKIRKIDKSGVIKK